MGKFTDKNQIFTVPKLDYIPDPRGVGYVYFNSMTKHGSKIAQIDAVTGQQDTFASLLQRCKRTAIKMRSMDVKPGDVISICSLNHLNCCVPFVATYFLGATIASLDPNLSANDIKLLIKLVNPKLVFSSEESVELIERTIEELNLKTQIVVFGDTTNHVPFSSFLTKVEEENDFQPAEVNLNTDALILFSSGTTGLPKGIRISHQSMLGQTAVTLAIDDCYDRILNFASFYWISTVFYCSISLVSGCTRIVVPKFDLNTVWSTIDTFQPTLIFTSPFHAMSMYQAGIPSTANINSVKTFTIGGGSLSKHQMLGLKKNFSKQRVFLSYGLSESGMTLYFIPGKQANEPFLDQKPLASGSGVCGFSYKIVDPDTERVLGPNEKGELRLKSQYMFSGYLNMDLAGIWDDDGYLKTGDIAYYDDDRYFYITDRLKEMLKYKSFHVLPSNIENVLVRHPSIKTAVVIGIPHHIDGDHPMALVVLIDNANVTEEDLIKYVNDRVSDREKLRGGLRIVESIPMTPTGKINRRAVKDQVVKDMVV